MSLRVIFMGTPEFSIPSLSEILQKGHEVAAVYTQPPRPAGRGGKTRKTPVHDFAEKAGLTVLTPKSLKKEAEWETFKSFNADVAIVIAYGLLLPPAILEACPLGCLNVHGSLLPRWRGAAPIQRAIMAGDRETGVMIMQMDEGLDTGDILLSEHIPIPPNMTAGDLHDEMMQRGAGLLGRALDALARGSIVATPQPQDGVTYAKKIEKAESRIDWSQTADEVHNHIRGLSPFPGAWFQAETAPGKIERIKVLRSGISEVISKDVEIKNGKIFIKCNDGSIELIELQREGKKPAKTKDFLNGLKGDFELMRI